MTTEEREAAYKILHARLARILTPEYVPRAIIPFPAVAYQAQSAQFRAIASLENEVNAAIIDDL